MKRNIILVLGFTLWFGSSFAQTNPFEKIGFIIGNWSGTGSGFGNTGSRIESSFQPVMDGNYLQVKNESWFEPTENNPKGEHHLDEGFISYDKSRKQIILRAFYSEGYFNQYVLNDSLSNENTLVFETEFIENFVPNGKAKLTIRKTSETEMETVFEVSFGKDYACFGENKLMKKQ